MIGGRSWIGLLLMAALVGGAVAGADGSSTEDATKTETVQRPPWSELEYVARKLLLKATATVTADYPSASGVSLEPVEEEDGLVPSSGELVQVTTRSDLPFGQVERMVSWLDGGSLAVLQASKLVTGRKHYRKLWRYRSHGYTRWRWEPEGDDDRSDPQTWSDRDVKQVSVEGSATDGGSVTDSYALIWLLSAARLDRQGASLRAELYADEQLASIEFVAQERRRQKVRLAETREGETVDRQEEIWVRQVVGRPADPELDIGFFGMQGELSVLVEEGTGIPVEIEGSADGIGHLRVRLRRVVYRSNH